MSKQTGEMVVTRVNSMLNLATIGDPRHPIAMETNRASVDYILQTAKWTRAEFINLMKSLGVP